jgi:hypothetical protein
VKGVDYSWARPAVATLRAAGVQAVGRYVGPAAWGKTITQAEYDTLVAAEMGVWLVYEGGTNDVAGGEPAGENAARQALRYLPVGYPAGAPVYFAVDKAIVPGPGNPAWVSTLAYLKGACSVVGLARMGVYGEGAVLAGAAFTRVASRFWLSESTAWPGTFSDPDIVQSTAPSGVPDADLDLMLKSILPPSPTPVLMLTRPYDSGPPVYRVQAILDKHGAGLVIDGVYGPATQAAVEQFQRFMGLAVDGVVGPQTWAALGMAA